MAKPKNSGAAYQLKMALTDIKPPIWRRVVVADGTLGDLHLVVQAAMGWEDCHLHSWQAGGLEYTNDPEELNTEDEEEVTLGTLAARGVKKLRYTYDFGDEWRHDIVIEKVLPPESAGVLPRCTAGKRACPLEDCGGPWGYAELLEVLADSEHPEHEERAEWAGGADLDPEAFDIDAINQRLKPDGK